MVIQCLRCLTIIFAQGHLWEIRPKIVIGMFWINQLCLFWKLVRFNLLLINKILLFVIIYDEASHRSFNLAIVFEESFLLGGRTIYIHEQQLAIRSGVRDNLFIFFVPLLLCILCLSFTGALFETLIGMKISLVIFTAIRLPMVPCLC